MRLGCGILALIFAVVALVTLLIVAIAINTKACHENGGELVGNGEYTTTFVISGNALIPIVSEGTECSYSDK